MSDDAIGPQDKGATSVLTDAHAFVGNNKILIVAALACAFLWWKHK